MDLQNSTTGNFFYLFCENNVEIRRNTYFLCGSIVSNTLLKGGNVHVFVGQTQLELDGAFA